MKPKQLPEGVRWEELPSFDELQQRSRLKVSLLRSALADVECWRCPDNSVRYDAAAADEALKDAGAATVGDGGADELEQELGKLGSSSSERALLLFVLRQALSMLADSRKQGADVIRAMQQPLERGMQLVDQLFERLTKRLDKHEEDWDRVVKLTEELMGAQLDRELRAKQVDASIKLRTEAIGTVNENLPKFIDRYMVGAEATTALDFMASLPDQLFDIVRDVDVLTEEQKATLAKLRRSLEARRAAAAKAAAKAGTGGNSSASSAPETPPPTPS